jgi:hypothetical protein
MSEKKAYFIIRINNEGKVYDMGIFNTSSLAQGMNALTNGRDLVVDTSSGETFKDAYENLLKKIVSQIKKDLD